MTDLAEKILAAIEAEEKAAAINSSHRHVRRGARNGTWTESRHRDEKRYNAILRLCAAHREIVAECVYVLEHNGDTGRTNGPALARFTLERLARGYGVQPDPEGDHA